MIDIFITVDRSLIFRQSNVKYLESTFHDGFTLETYSMEFLVMFLWISFVLTLLAKIENSREIGSVEEFVSICWNLEKNPRIMRFDLNLTCRISNGSKIVERRFSLSRSRKSKAQSIFVTDFVPISNQKVNFAEVSRKFSSCLEIKKTLDERPLKVCLDIVDRK